MNMREKIARAALKMWHYANMTAVPEFDGLPDLEKQQWLLVADGVLDALMEPTEGMVGAVARITWETLLPRAGAWGGDRSIDGMPFRNAARQALVEAARAAKEGK